MPQVYLKFEDPKTGKTEILSEYRCDWPQGCDEEATQVIGVIREIRQMCALCDEHALELHKRKTNDAA